VPKSSTEQEEAQWWDERMDVVEENLVEAIQSGTAESGAARRLLKEARESKNITIRIPVKDIERARALAEKKGLGYQTYMKMLLHEALTREEKRRAG
jgi:predicted DNA binding CopG/RHH family protein